ncbi:MAG: TonB-dependent receptor plug domain-containing protein, partial [Bacteroidota bacterium]
MKRTLLLCLALFLAFTTHAQQKKKCKFEMKGIIKDAETKEIVPYATVRVRGTEHYCVADEDGHFHLKGLCNETDTLIISCIGYGETTCGHSHQKGKNEPIFIKSDVVATDAVTITGEKLSEEGTVSISQETLGKEQLASVPTQSLAAALSEVEGVTFVSTGSNVQLPVIHGLYGNRVLVLNNGIKHGFQNWGRDHAPEIDVQNANSVTVVKGAAGVRYGPEALAGAIIVESDPLSLNERLNASVGTGFQTNGRGYFFNSEVGQGGEKFSYHVGAGYNRLGDLHTPDYSLTNSGKEEKSINGGIRYAAGNWDFKAYYSFVDQNLAVLRYAVAHSGGSLKRAINSTEPNPDLTKPFSYDINEPNQLAKHHLGKIEVDWRYSENAQLTFRYGKQLNQRQEFDVRRNAERPIIDLDLVTDDFQLEWKHPDWFGLDGLIGFQALIQNNDNNPGTNNTPFIPNYNTFRYSLFAVESLERDRNTFEFGVRFDYESNDVRGRELNNDLFVDNYNFTNVTASLGYIREISENTTFRTNLGAAWRTPNVAELFSFGQHGFKLQYGLLRFYTNSEGEPRTDRVIPLSESDVSPEVGYKWINEWRIKKNASTLTLTAYAHYIQNFIYDRPLGVFGTIRGPTPAWIFVQGDAMFLGGDLTWQTKWSEDINGTFGVSYLWSRNIEQDEPLINQPPITTSYQLLWNTKPFWGLTSSKLSVRPSYTFRQFQAPRKISIEEVIDGGVVITPESEVFDYQDARTDELLAGYFLFDISWRFESNRLSGSLAIRNAFNARYRDYLNEMRYFADE